MQKHHDIHIAGAGPAGLALGAELGQLGLDVLVIDPSCQDRWERSFGTFRRSGLHESLAEAVAYEFPRCRITFPSGRTRLLSEGYVRFDTARLQEALRQRALRAGVRLETGLVHLGTRTTKAVELRTSRGSENLSPRLLIDATGSGLTPTGEPKAYQTAYGAWVTAARHGLNPDQMCLMDCRPIEDGRALPPTFLYGLPESNERIFVQETVLCSAFPVSFDTLRDRLIRRLTQMGVGPFRISSEEFCIIPLGLPIPPAQRYPLPFGAAAAMIQPSSGYQLARSLGLANEVAATIARALAQGREAEEVAGAALANLWSKERRRAFTLYQFGLETLLRFDQERWGAFLESFFELPEPLIAGFMEGTLSSAEVTSCLWNVLVKAPMGLRFELLASGSRSLGRLKQSLT